MRKLKIVLKITVLLPFFCLQTQAEPSDSVVDSPKIRAKLIAFQRSQHSLLATKAPAKDSAPVITLSRDGTGNPSINDNAKFVILDLIPDSHVPTEVSPNYTYFYNIQKQYDAKFGGGTVQIVDGSNTTVTSLISWLQSQAILAAQVRFLWVLSNHGLQNSGGGPTLLFWGCGSGTCLQQADLSKFINISLSSLYMGWFDACYTHVTTDAISSVTDGTATGWMHLYNKNAYACGFTSYTTFFSIPFTECVFSKISGKYINLDPNRQAPQPLSATDMSATLAACRTEVPAIGQVSMGAPYCTGNGSTSLPRGVFQSVRLVNNIPSAVLINMKDPSKSISLPQSSAQDPATLDAATFYSLIGESDLTSAIQNNSLTSLFSNILVKDLVSGKTAPCVNSANPKNSPDITFDNQFNGFNINVGSTGGTPYCVINYGYISS